MYPRPRWMGRGLRRRAHASQLIASLSLHLRSYKIFKVLNCHRQEILTGEPRGDRMSFRGPAFVLHLGDAAPRAALLRGELLWRYFSRRDQSSLVVLFTSQSKLSSVASSPSESGRKCFAVTSAPSVPPQARQLLQSTGDGCRSVSRSQNEPSSSNPEGHQEEPADTLTDILFSSAP